MQTNNSKTPVKGIIGALFVDPTVMFQSNNSSMLMMEMQQQQQQQQQFMIDNTLMPMQQQEMQFPTLSDEEQKQYNIYVAEQFYKEQEAFQAQQRQQQEAFDQMMQQQEQNRNNRTKYDGINFVVEQCVDACLPTHYFWRKEGNTIKASEKQCLQQCARKSFLMQLRAKQVLDQHMDMFETPGASNKYS